MCFFIVYFFSAIIYTCILSTLCHFDYSKYTVLIYYGFTVFLELILYDVVGFFLFTLTFFKLTFFLLFFWGELVGQRQNWQPLFDNCIDPFYLDYFSYNHVFMNNYALSVKLRKSQRSVHYVFLLLIKLGVLSSSQVCFKIITLFISTHNNCFCLHT